ncbi:MAG: ATP-binding protein [Dehalococcoidia bacterium]|nr:ATP-binding protein [Dehalococcoidia bacterium]
MTPGPPDDAAPPPDLFHLMVDSVRDYALFMLTPTGHIMTWNQGAERLKKYRAEEIVGRHFSIFYPAGDVRAGKPEYELRVALEVGRFEDEGWRIRKDGSRFWANVIITAVRDATGGLVGFAKVTRDLSERKQSEVEREILLETERSARLQAETASARLDALRSVTEAGLMHVGLDNLADALAAQVEALLAADHAGVVLGDLQEQTPLAKRGPAGAATDSVIEAIVERLMRNQTPLLYQEGLDLGARQDARSGSWLAVPLVVDGAFIGVLYAGSEVTSRFREDDLALLEMMGSRVALALEHARVVEAERDARAQVLAAQESAHVRNEFIAVAAHELKTPLTSIRMAAQMAARRLAGSDPGTHTLLEQVVAQAGRLNRLIAGLLDASRMDMGRLEMLPEQTDVSAIVRDVVASTRRTSEREIALQERGQVVATVDPLRFEQVVMNLVDNAVKYSPAPQPVAVELACEDDDGFGFRLSVRDHGIGIPPGLRQQVFERYFQGHSENRQSGLGLGLYITREIVLAHGGSIEAESPADGGSLFTVRMPMAFPDPAAHLKD